jgi:hypothetical protein
VLGSVVNGEADPYGEPRTLPQKTKKREMSMAKPGPLPIAGLHQSSMSLLPDNAWQTTNTLSPSELSTPQVLKATGNECS